VTFVKKVRGKQVRVMHGDEKSRLGGGCNLHFGHLNDSVKHALFDGFGGNLAGSVGWFHVVSRHGAIRHVEIVIVNGTPGFVVE
jgi:hypothetical protein